MTSVAGRGGNGKEFMTMAAMRLDAELQRILGEYERQALQGGQRGLLLAIDGLRAMAECLERRWRENDFSDAPAVRWVA